MCVCVRVLVCGACVCVCVCVCVFALFVCAYVLVPVCMLVLPWIHGC